MKSVSRIEDYALGIFGFTAYNSQDNTIVVTFRGSQNIANWISNIDFLKSNYKSLASTI